MNTDTSDWTPVQIEAKILDIVNRMAKGVMMCDTAYKTFLAADRVFDVAYAKAYLGAVGTIPEKTYAAVIATEIEREARDVADAAYKVVKRQSDAYDAQLDAYRSIGASIRQQYAVAGVGER
jgi:hypothetical protein